MSQWPLVTPMGALYLVFVLCVAVGCWAYVRQGMEREMRNHMYWVRRTQEQLDRTHMGQPYGRPYDWEKE